MGETAELRQHERRPLRLWQLADVCEQRSEFRSPLNLVGELDRGSKLVESANAPRPGLEHRHAAVACNCVQPRLQAVRPDTVPALKVRPSAGERLLKGFFGIVGRAEDVPAHREDAAGVALVGDLERGLVPAPDLLR
jgi:hypothetical protein